MSMAALSVVKIFNGKLFDFGFLVILSFIFSLLWILVHQVRISIKLEVFEEETLTAIEEESILGNDEDQSNNSQKLTIE